MALQVTPAAYQLPAGISREVVLARGSDLLIIGGLNQRSVTTSAITELNPVTGRTTRAGRLADPSHDAAGALLGGQAVPVRRRGAGQPRGGPVAAAQRHSQRDRAASPATF